MSESHLIGAAYARMSTAMQNEKSPEDQIRVCRERARADGVVIPDENVFIDRAVSGTKPDRSTGQSKGFGFVEMGSDSEAQAAITALNGQDHGGRSLTVSEAKPRAPRSGGGYGGGGHGGYGRGR